MPTHQKRTSEILIPPIASEHYAVEVRELTTLIQHRFAEKALKIMTDRQQGHSSGPREFKDPEALMRAACYVVPGMDAEPDGEPGKFYQPGISFKHAAEDATRYAPDRKLTKVKAKGAFFIDEYATLSFTEMRMREDVVRNATGVADVRYRPEFSGWSAQLLLSLSPNSISLQQVLTLLNLGGFHCGVGEWRPSAPKTSGQHGRFEVVGVEEVDASWHRYIPTVDQ